MRCYLVYLDDHDQYRFDIVDNPIQYEREIEIFYPAHGDFYSKVIQNDNLINLLNEKTFYENSDECKDILEDLENMDKIISKYTKPDILLKTKNRIMRIQNHIRNTEVDTEVDTEVVPIDINIGLQFSYSRPKSSWSDIEPIDNESGLPLSSIQCKNAHVYFNTEFQCLYFLDMKKENISLKEIEYVSEIFSESVKRQLEELNFTNVSSIKKYIEFITQNCTTSSKNIIEYLKKMFDISVDIADKIKFSSIYEMLISEMVIKNKEDARLIKNILPKCLKEIGLNKKRYSDGQYWYGLKKKDIKISGIIPLKN